MNILTKREAIFLILVILAFIGAGLAYPKFGIWLSYGLQISIKPLSILLAVSAIAFSAYYWYKKKRAPDSADSERPSRGITRRAFLLWLVTGAGAIGLSYAWWKSSKMEDGKISAHSSLFKPRFRHKRVAAYISKLAPGFYLNPNSQIIHYVLDDKRIPGVSRIDEARLERQDPTGLSIDTKKPRVNKSRASFSFEVAAIAHLRQNNIDEACELLTYAVRQDLNARYYPSYRLYDLLAGITVRFGKKSYLDGLIDLITKQGSQSRQVFFKRKFEDRINKWSNPKSKWYVRWADKDKKVSWDIDRTERKKIPGITL